MTRKEIDRTFVEAGLMDQFMIPPDFIRGAVGHFLALGHQIGSMPPLVQFLEAVGVSSVQPELISAASVLDTIQDGRTIGADAFEDLLTEGLDLVDDYFFVESWFEVGDEVDAVLTDNRACTQEARGTHYGEGDRTATRMVDAGGGMGGLHFAPGWK
jgi:hypothetical protein